MLTRDTFRSNVIAQADDEDWQESGWVAVLYAGVAYLTRYGHCSCYGTWTAICGGGVNKSAESLPDNWYVWSGTPAELLDMAVRRADPAIPEREMDNRDHDAHHLRAVYAQLIERWQTNESILG